MYIICSPSIFPLCSISYFLLRSSFVVCPLFTIFTYWHSKSETLSRSPSVNLVFTCWMRTLRDKQLARALLGSPAQPSCLQRQAGWSFSSPRARPHLRLPSLRQERRQEEGDGTGPRLVYVVLKKRTDAEGSISEYWTTGTARSRYSWKNI